MKQQDEEVMSTCDGCGASVYQEHLDSGIAKVEEGKLHCAHCVAEQGSSQGSAAAEAIEPIQLDIPSVSPSPADSGTSEMSSSRIHGLSEATLGHQEGGFDSDRFNRKLDPTSPFATRCRTFHCKLSEGAIEFLNNQINEWLDKNEDVSIKFVHSNIGPFEGKHTEPNMILTLFF